MWSVWEGERRDENYEFFFWLFLSISDFKEDAFSSWLAQVFLFRLHELIPSLGRCNDAIRSGWWGLICRWRSWWTVWACVCRWARLLCWCCFLCDRWRHRCCWFGRSGSICSTSLMMLLPVFMLTKWSAIACEITTGTSFICLTAAIPTSLLKCGKWNFFLEMIKIHFF